MIKKLYRLRLEKLRRQKELNDLVDKSNILFQEQWDYIKGLPENEKIFIRTHDSKEMKVFLVSKADKLSLNEIRKIRRLMGNEEIICYARLAHYMDNGFSKTYVY